MQATALALRESLSAVTGAANRDISALLQRVTTAAQAQQALGYLLPAIVDQYGLAAATLAAQWYDEQRIKAEVKGRFEATPADLGPSGAEALMGYGTTPLQGDSPNFSLARTLLSGGLQRRIQNYARATVTDASVADPQARGWSREGSGECDFCAILIGRGEVYSEASADFASHDHCQCVAVPAFNGRPRPVKPYTPTSSNITDADRARVRAYIASH